MNRRARILLALLLFAPAAVVADVLKPGDAFPAWSLPNQASKPVTSEQLAGKRYLIWFYPKAMTPGCTAEGQGLRDQFGKFESAGVAIYGVSFDTPADNAQFAAAEHFPFQLLSDTQRVLARQVGAADSSTQAVARRISYLVGADGKVLDTYANVTPASHASAVLADVH
ncbi:MAG: peroxiredoxin [bacterium]